MSQTLVTAHELAERLKVKDETIHRWSRQRKIPHVLLPDGAYRYPLEEIMQNLRIEPTQGEAA